MNKDMRMGAWGFPIKRSMTCNQKTVLCYMNKQPDKAATIRHIMFNLDWQEGQVFYYSTVGRVLDAMLKNGKIYRHGEYYVVEDGQS